VAEEACGQRIDEWAFGAESAPCRAAAGGSKVTAWKVVVEILFHLQHTSSNRRPTKVKVAMASTLLYLALLQVASALALPVSTSSTTQPTTHRLHRRELATGVKVALGICIPGAVLVVGLFVVIIAFYPAQLRKLRAQNPGQQIGLAELMTGKAAPPPYSAEHDGSSSVVVGHEGMGQGTVGGGHGAVNGSETVVPKNNVAPPGYNTDARHAALAG
jgi:hypothetical protein